MPDRERNTAVVAHSASVIYQEMNYVVKMRKNDVDKATSDEVINNL